MKKYTLEIVIEEGSDEFWEELIAKNKTGCEEIQDCLINMLYDHGFIIGQNTKLTLKKFENY